MPGCRAVSVQDSPPSFTAEKDELPELQCQEEPRCTFIVFCLVSKMLPLFSLGPELQPEMDRHLHRPCQAIARAHSSCFALFPFSALLNFPRLPTADCSFRAKNSSSMRDSSHRARRCMTRLASRYSGFAFTSTASARSSSD